MISDIGVMDGENMSWNLDFRRRLTDAEIAEFAELTEMLDRVLLNEEEDDLLWRDGKKNYSVKDCSELISATRVYIEEIGTIDFQWRKVWLAQVPSRINFGIWQMVRGRVLTADVLKRRGYHMASRCFLCEEEDESIDHLLLNCKLSRKVWDYFWFNSSRTWPNDVGIREFVFQWGSEKFSKAGNLYWKLICHAILWTLWVERNNRCFEEKKETEDRLISKVKDLVWNWGLGSPKTKNLRLESLLFNWDGVLGF
ncbi:hypothetical protein ACHQM5_004769 [Ranunculus cassubicifolius]